MPIYRDYEIDYDPPPVPSRVADWQYRHIDYDGPEDNRAGFGPSFFDCCRQIDEAYEEPAVMYHTIGDGDDGWLEVRYDDKISIVAALALLETDYCDVCELPLEACACADADEYDREWNDLQRAYGIPESFIKTKDEYHGPSCSIYDEPWIAELDKRLDRAGHGMRSSRYANLATKLPYQPSEWSRRFVRPKPTISQMRGFANQLQADFDRTWRYAMGDPDACSYNRLWRAIGCASVIVFSLAVWAVVLLL